MSLPGARVIAEGAEGLLEGKTKEATLVANVTVCDDASNAGREVPGAP